VESLPSMDDPYTPQLPTSKSVPKERTGCVTLYIYAIGFVFVSIPLGIALGTMFAITSSGKPFSIGVSLSL
jgi:hypothetical protein